MRGMLSGVLGVVAVICAAGWLVNRVNTMALLWYLQEKNYPFPTNEDLKKGSKYVVEHMVKDLFGSKQK